MQLMPKKAECLQNRGMPSSEHNNNGLLKEVEALRERLCDKDRHIETLANQVEDV